MKLTHVNKMFTTFCKGKIEKNVMHSLAPALTLSLTLSLKRLTNKQLWST